MMNLNHLLSELSSGDDERSEAAIPAIAAHGENAVQPLRSLLSSPDVDTRWWAVRALAEVPGAQIPELLVNALEDEEVTVRQCAALALRRQPDVQAVPALIAALKSEDRLVANLAGDALVAIGEPAVPSLLEVLKSGAQPERLVAVRALALIGDHRSIPTLFEALSEDSMVLEYWASEGLERMGVGMAFFKP